MLLGTASRSGSLPVFPLALGGVSILASVVGIYFARIGKGGSIINALYKSVLVATDPLGARLHPRHDGVRATGRFSFWRALRLRRSSASRSRSSLVAITEFYTGSRWNPVKSIAKASRTGPRHEHHRGPRRRHARDRGAR